MDTKKRNIIALCLAALLVAAALWVSWRPSETIAQGTDIQGGLSVTLTMQDEETPITSATMDEAQAIVEHQIEALGINKATVQQRGTNAILIQIPGIKTERQARGVLGSDGLAFIGEMPSDTPAASKALASAAYSYQIVGPKLGQQSLQEGLLAIGVGLALVTVVMFVRYRRLAALMFAAMIAFVVLVTGVLAALSRMGVFSLSLPGIAGVILGTGIASGSSILLIEQLKDELAAGRSPQQAAISGPRRATQTILDAAVITGLPGLLFLFIASGPLRGFGLTLIVATICDIVVTLLIKVPLIKLVLLATTKRVRSQGASALAAIAKKSPHIDFLANRRITFSVSVILIVISLVAVVVGGLNIGVEFSGGATITIANTGSLTPQDITTVLRDAGITGSSIQTTQEQGANGFIVRTNDIDPAQADIDMDAIASKLGVSEDAIEVMRIGPDWGKAETTSSLIAAFISLLAIGAYLAWRFERAVVASAAAVLLHDVIIVVGVYALSARAVTPDVIGAFLVILGYSLYNTVVMFDRIQENTRHAEGATLQKSVNTSANEVFMRSLIISLTSLIPALCLLLFGGATLGDFAFAMVVGIVLGAGSSVAAAMPTYVILKEREAR